MSVTTIPRMRGESRAIDQVALAQQSIQRGATWMRPSRARQRRARRPIRSRPIAYTLLGMIADQRGNAAQAGALLCQGRCACAHAGRRVEQLRRVAVQQRPCRPNRWRCSTAPSRTRHIPRRPPRWPMPVPVPWMPGSCPGRARPAARRWPLDPHKPGGPGRHGRKANTRPGNTWKRALFPSADWRQRPRVSKCYNLRHKSNRNSATLPQLLVMFNAWGGVSATADRPDRGMRVNHDAGEPSCRTLPKACRREPGLWGAVCARRARRPA